MIIPGVLLTSGHDLDVITAKPNACLGKVNTWFLNRNLKPFSDKSLANLYYLTKKFKVPKIKASKNL